MKKGPLVYLLLLFITVAQALPKFHTGNNQINPKQTLVSISTNLTLRPIVNGHFNNGTVCPAQTKQHVPCPALCVSDLSQCPTLPTCSAPGETLCGDGACHQDCSTVAPPSSCTCPSNPGVRWVKCPLSTYIDIPQWDPSKNDIQTYTICSAAYNYSSTVPTWASMESNTTALWNVCDAPAGMTFPIMGKLTHDAGKRLLKCALCLLL